MARFLFASQPITGHVLPALPIVQKLVAEGHEVVWYCGRKFQPKIEAVGACFASYQQAYDYNDDDYNAAFPDRSQYQGLAQIRFDMQHIFGKQVGPQYRDLQNILAQFPADVIIGDPSVFAAFAVSEKGGPPHVVYNITVLGLQGQDVAPFGLGLLPSSSPLGRIRNRLLAFLAANVIFKRVSDEFVYQSKNIGITPHKFEGVVTSRFLFLQPTVPGFEYPRRDLPPQVHFIGALIPNQRADFKHPTWWNEVIHKKRPVVLVTQGTVATNARDLVAPTLQALADEDVLVIAAGVKDSASLGLDVLPANVRLEPFVPFSSLMPYIDLFITNGGYGGVMTALSHGVPIIAGGVTEDKPEVSNRIMFSEVGHNLRTATPQPEQIKAAFHKIMDNRHYRHKAQVLQAELARYDAPSLAVSLLERLAQTRQPVLRS